MSGALGSSIGAVTREECARSLERLEDRQDYAQATPAEVAELLTIAEWLDDDELRWRARRLAAELAGRRGELAEATRELARVQEYATAQGHAQLLARAHLSLAWNFRDIGDHTSYIEHAVQAVEQLDVHAPASVRALHLIRLADALDECGSRQEAQERYEQAEDVAVGGGDVTRQVSCLNNRAYGEYLAGELDQAQATIARLVDVCRVNDLPLRAHTLDTIARIEISVGRYDDAVGTSLRATEAFHQQGVVEVLAPVEFLLTRAAAERLRGRHAAAQGVLDGCREMATSAGLASLAVKIDEEQSELHAARGDFESAYRSFRAYHDGERALLSEQLAAQSRLRQTALGTEEARARADQFRYEAVHDPLTGLFNRRYVDERLPRLLEDRRGTQPVAAALIDLDYFKRINDTCSHSAGDQVLVMVASLIDAAVSRWRSHVARDGFAARMGGEEFVLVLTGAPGSDVLQVVEDLRRAVAEHDWTTACGTIPVTISVGLACAREQDSQSTMLRRADELLYAAKRDGRNRIGQDGSVLGARHDRPHPATHPAGELPVGTDA